MIKAVEILNQLRCKKNIMNNKFSVSNYKSSTLDQTNPIPEAKSQNRNQITSAPELLAMQPVTLMGMQKIERATVVVSAVADSLGNEHVLSRFGNEVWNLSSEILAVNRSSKTKRIVWPNDIPQDLIEDAKIAVYCAMRQGRNDINWSASSAAAHGPRIEMLLRHLARQGISNFSQIRPLHVSTYIVESKKRIDESTIYTYLQILDIAWSFRQELLFPLLEHPFSGKSLYRAVGLKNTQKETSRVAKTPVIPRSVQIALWTYCESIIDSAAPIFIDRDNKKIDVTSSGLAAIRDVALYQLQICTGMRNSESTGVTNRCWRTENKMINPKKEISFHWISTREIKTTGGEMLDYLAPAELFRSLDLLQRYAEPLQRRLADEARWLENIIDTESNAQGAQSNGKSVLQNIERLSRIREIGQHMMLITRWDSSDHLNSGSYVDVMTSNECNVGLRRVARSAGVSWKIANHQCRRTYAWNVANSRLGRMGLVFIKWQFKHLNLGWTQLYAANPRQDQALYQEFVEATFESKTEVIQAWHNADSRLSGGAGKKLLQTRGMPVRDMAQLLAATADTIILRSTGHAWCLSGTQGCHGQGIYDPTMCGGCSQAIIDESQGSRWQMIHLDNLRLAAVTDCGPAIAEKVGKAVAMSTQVLSDLCVALPSPEQALAYESGVWLE